MKLYLVLVETLQIQPYVFGSNRLRENIGASYLVAQATDQWAIEALPPRHNVGDDGSLRPDPIEHGEVEAEVVYKGGGNFAALFQDSNQAKAFTTKLSRRVLRDAPNLQIAIAQQDLEWDVEGALHDKLVRAFQQLAEMKRSRVMSAPLLGLGVSVMCQSTGLPAVAVTEPINNDPNSRYPASAEICAKLNALDDANKKLRNAFDGVLDRDYDFPYDLDNLGRSEGKFSHIAVVHADGDAMGERISQLGQRHGSDSRTYANQLREFSEQVKHAGKEALRATLRALQQAINPSKEIVHRNAFKVELARISLEKGDRGRWYLPFRPIVFGGDDVTFVCDGRLGVSLARLYIEAFHKETSNLDEGPATASAGVAIVKTHYPFARAYALAEQLTRSAKAQRRKLCQAHGEQWQGSGLDWHFALSGLAGDLDEIREREFQAPAGSLTLRPVVLDAPEGVDEQKSWTLVEAGLHAFQDTEGETPQWSTRRNKLKALRDALRQGPAAVERFRAVYLDGEPLPPLASGYNDDLQNYGWAVNTCGYFDALELADWYVPLGGKT